MDTLGELSGSDSEGEHKEEPNVASEAPKKRKVQGADRAPAALQALGLKGGASILAVPEPQENSNSGWEW